MLRRGSWLRPIRRNCRRMLATFSAVVIAGCWPVCTANCSAGSPNASKPIVYSTLCPVMRLNRLNTSVPMKPSGWPTCSPVPLGYGNMSNTNSFGWSTTAGSPSGPLGLAVWNVP